MKKLIFQFRSYFLMGWIILSTMTFDVVGQVTYSESFDGATFPPAGWTNSGPGSLWVRRTMGTNPTCMPHSGAAMARFSAFNQPPGSQDYFNSPVVDLSFSAGNVPTFSLWVFRDSSSTAGDSVTIFVNTALSLAGATRIGAVARSRYFVLPVNELVNGWYEYTFNVPSTFDTDTNYFIMQGTSLDGANIYIDDISWVAYPEPCSGAPTVGTLNANPSIICGGSGQSNLLLTGATTFMSGISYHWQWAPTDTGTWTDFGPDAAMANTGTLDTSTYFRCYITCSFSGMTDTSAIQLVTISPDPPPVVTVFPNTNLVHCTGASPLVLVASGAATYTWSPDIAIPNGVGDSALAAPFMNTFYNIVGTDSAGCIGNTTIQVTVANSPNVNGFTNNDTLCEGQSANLSAFVQGPGMGIQFQWNPGALPGPNQTVTPTVSTPYVVSATSMQNGCVGHDTVLITVNPVNIAAFTYSVNLVTVTFTNGSTGGTSWSWDFGDGNTSTDENPVYTYAGENTYTVTLIVSNGLCPNDTIIQQVVVGSVGIENLGENSGLILYPNPVSSLMTIQFVSEDNSAEISIVNTLGQIEKQFVIERGVERNFNVEMDLEKLAAGLYLLKIQSATSNHITSFIKK